MSAKKILIAEDNAKLLQALTMRLEAEGYEVIASQDAYQALGLRGQHLPDLLLLDINMPAGDGFSVQERIANIKELADTPVIYVTGETTERVDRAAQQHHAFAIVHKPFVMRELLTIIASALNQDQDRQQPARTLSL